jgi:thymidine kinase
MGAGKSAALLLVAHNYDCIGQQSKTYTSALDDRFGESVVASRMGISRVAHAFNRDTVFDLDTVGEGIRCVLVDEAQFLTTTQVVQLHRLAALHGVPVICFGLRTDFRGVAFEGSAALGVIADQIEELKSVCTCGKKASFNVRFDADGNRVKDGAQIQIGGNATYQQACAACFYGDSLKRQT